MVYYIIVSKLIKKKKEKFMKIKKLVSIMLIFVMATAVLSSLTLSVFAAPIQAEPPYSIPNSELPEGALITDWFVSRENRSTPADAEPYGNNPMPGRSIWMYEMNWEVGSQTILAHGDRTGINANNERRTFTIEAVPEILEGAHFLQGPNDSRADPTDTMMFTALVDMRVFVGIDMRHDLDTFDSPFWLVDRGWTHTNYFVLNNENMEVTSILPLLTQLFGDYSYIELPMPIGNHYILFYMDFNAGDVVHIGGTMNTGRSSNLVFVKDISPEPEPTPEPEPEPIATPDPVAPTAPTPVAATGPAPQTFDPITLVVIGAFASAAGVVIVKKRK